MKALRKNTLFFIGIVLLQINVSLMAQSYNGIWQGQVAGQNGTLNASMTLQVASNNQLKGELKVINNGVADNYIVKGAVTPTSASGTLTYKDNTVFGFKMQLTNDQIQQTISYNNQVILQGVFVKGEPAVNQTITPKPTDNLYRDPNLVGKWTNQENYSSNGGFYGGSSSSIILNADGSIEDGGSSSYVSGPNSSGNSQGGGNQTIAQAKAAGARWFTKGNIFYWRINVNGKMTDVPNSKYYIERGALLLTDLKTGKKLLYYKK